MLHLDRQIKILVAHRRYNDLYHISVNQSFKYTKHKNLNLIQKQYPLYLLFGGS